MGNQYQKITIWLLTLIAFFLPFEYIGSFEFKGITVRISQILAVFLIFAWLLGLFKRRINYQKNYLILPLVVFLGINLLSLVKAADFNRSLSVFSFLLFTTFFGWLITQVIRNKNDLTKIVATLFLSAFIVSLFGFWQFFGDVSGVSPSWTGLRPNYVKEKIGFPRVHSTAYEPLYYANYLFIPLFLALALWIRGRESRGKSQVSTSEGLGNLPTPSNPSHLWEGVGEWVVAHYNLWLIFLIFLTLSNLILTVARGAYLSFIPSFFILILFFQKEFKNPRKLITFILLISLITIFNWQLIHYFDRSSPSLNQLKYEWHIFNLFGGSSYKERRETTTLAWQAFKENLILGLGIGGFGPYAKRHLPWWQQNEWKIVNNEYLEILAETGILGFISFIVLIAIIIYKLIKTIYQTKDEYLKTILIGLLIAFIAVLIQYLTFSTLYIMHIWFLIGMLVAITQILKNQKMTV